MAADFLANCGPYGGRLSDHMAADFSANFGPYGGRFSDHMAADFRPIWLPMFDPEKL
jgi:hypothetical protein